MTKKEPVQENKIPEFSSREEEAEWYDTHDLADYQDELKAVRKVHVAKNLSEGLNIRLDEATLTELRSRAARIGIGPTTLARIWLLEHLQELKDKAEKDRRQSA